MRLSLIAGSFFTLTQLFPRLRPLLWRSWYNRLASNDRTGEWLFMNYGYSNGQDLLPLSPEDEQYRYPAQLYAYVVSKVDISGKDILEMGCGRGGGGSFYLKYYQPATYIGVDISDAAIRWCNDRFVFPNAKWLQGRADAIPVPDSSIDVVVNVESSHSYPSMYRFIQEVVRVLRPGGYFCFCDLRTPDGAMELVSLLIRMRLQVVAQEEITPHVIRALDAVSPIRERQIRKYVPGWLRSGFRDFAGIKNSILYEMMKERKMVYTSCVMRKPSQTAGYDPEPHNLGEGKRPAPAG